MMPPPDPMPQTLNRAAGATHCSGLGIGGFSGLCHAGDLIPTALGYHGVMVALAFDTDRALPDVQWLVEKIGPRVHQSEAEADAVRGVVERLREAGWAVQLRGGSPVACRGDAGTLFLAHLDTVEGSPGAVDNAAAVAVLLELARTSQAPDLCLGFPVGEEHGLRGSRMLAAQWTDGPLNLVVSLDLIGRGRPTAIDLDRSWGTDEIRWLHERSEIDTPLLHRIVGRAAPQWRSDHGPFAARGTLAFQIMTRGPDAVFTRYHQTTDDRVYPDAMLATAEALEGLATGGPPPRSSGDPAIAIGRFVVSGAAVWSVIGLGVLSGLPGLPRLRQSVPDLARLGVMMLVAAVFMLVPLVAGFPVTEAEATVANVIGHAETGWWAATPWAVAAAWAGWLVLWRSLPGTGHPALMAALLSVPLSVVDPLLALPFAVAAIGVRVHPLLGLAPAVLVIRPTTLQEFAFWGLLSPWRWPLLFMLTFTAIGRIHNPR